MLYVKYYKINIRVIIIFLHAQLADNKFYLVLNIYSVNKALLLTSTRVTPTCLLLFYGCHGVSTASWIEWATSC